MTKRLSGSRSLRTALAGLGCAGLLLCLPAVASAATTIGADMTNNTPHHSNTCNGTVTACDLSPLTEGAFPQVAPANGVVTRWRVEDSSGPLALRVIRPAGGGQYLFVSSSVTEVPTNTGIVTFDTRQPIQAGDYIGVELQSATATIGVDATEDSPNASVAVWAGPLADGALAPPALVANPARGYVNADIEPDADHDGFGDETQDQCPTNAATQGVCPQPPPDTTPPVVKASGKVAHLSPKNTISFFLTSSEASTGTVGGTISLPKLAKVVRFTSRKLTLMANVKTRVNLKLSKRNAAAVRKALKAKKHVTARITARLKDAAGNPTARKLSVRLKR